MKCSESNRMKVREYCYVKRSRSMSVMLRYMYTTYAKFLGDFYSKRSLLRIFWLLLASHQLQAL